ncbi:hypothetical protein IKE79_01955, partial [Candidatus Saccharibacteria bacterium]|nr:hypothetical protein [Candidatus Saccharibacteria bacterium]
KMNNDTPADTYGTTLVFVATTDPIPTCNPNEICYKGNGSDGGTFMANQTDGYDKDGNTVSVSVNQDIMLRASNYRKYGYGFAGWSTEQLDPDSASFNTNLATAVSAGKVYGSNQTITLPNDMNSGLTLYAVWVKSAGNMQGWTCPNNTNMPIGTVTALTDNRDGNVYAVAKLADGKCWMMENLRLGSNASLTGGTTGNTNSNTSVTGSVALSIVNNYADNATSNHIGGASWCFSTSDSCINQSFIDTGYVSSPIANMTSNSDGVYSYGVYYNYYSATAGNGLNGGYGEVSGDICPRSWRLPIGGTSTAAYSIGALMNLWGTSTGSGTYDQTAAATARTFPNNYVMSGISGRTPGASAAYHSSTESGGFIKDYGINFVRTYTNPANNGRMWPFAVRCLANS